MTDLASEWVESTVFMESMSTKYMRPLSKRDYLDSKNSAVEQHAARIHTDLQSEAAVLRDSPLTGAWAERCVLSCTSLSEVVAAVLAEKLRRERPV